MLVFPSPCCILYLFTQTQTAVINFKFFLFRYLNMFYFPWSLLHTYGKSCRIFYWTRIMTAVQLRFHFLHILLFHISQPLLSEILEVPEGIYPIFFGGITKTWHPSTVLINTSCNSFSHHCHSVSWAVDFRIWKQYFSLSVWLWVNQPLGVVSFLLRLLCMHLHACSCVYLCVFVCVWL